MTPLAQLLRSLEKCVSLTRLSLVAPSQARPHAWDGAAFGRCLVHLVQRLPRLVAFCVVLSVPLAHCSAAAKQVLQPVEMELA